MKIKLILASAAIALSSQAYAATDTSCNPYARGASCNSAAFGTFSDGSSFGELMSNFRSLAASLGIINRSSSKKNRRLGRKMRRLAASIDESSFFDENEVDLDESEEIIGGSDVAVVPVPAAGFLILTGLGGLVMVRRKQS